ncbi:Serine protease, subtilase family, partial [Candidatus Methanophagaceae archaeon]
TSVSVDGVVVEDPVPELGAGESYTNTVGAFECPCGTNVTVLVCADSDNDVNETEEENNCLENVFVCPPIEKPDLVISDKYEKWVSLENLTYNITYTVCNDGDADAGVSNTTITIDGVDVMEDPVHPLAVGECYTSTVGPFTMSDTNDTILVCADNQNEVDESDEENNCFENVFESIIPEGGIGVSVTPRFNTVNSSVNLSIKVVNTENFDDVFVVSLTNETLPPDWRADLSWFNWTSTEVAIPAGGEVLIPLRADVPTNVPAGTKAFRVVVESTLWTPTVFDTGILEIL